METIIDNYSHLPRIVQPRNLSKNLFQHQLVSVHMMEQLEREKRVIKNDIITETCIGMNCNIMGYGKTLEMITLILRDKMEWNLDTPYTKINYRLFSGDRIIKKRISGYIKLPTTLIVASTSIIHQWLNEFNNTDLQIGQVTKKSHIREIKPEDFDAIIVSPGMYNHFIDRFCDYAWKRFIFDEPSHIKIPAMRHVEAGFIWFVTSTPNLMQNLYGNCHSTMIYDIIKYSNITQLFEDVTIRVDPEFVKASFKLPEVHHKYYKCYDPLFKVIRGIASDKIQGMIAAGNISGAVSELNGKSTSNIIELVKSKKIKELQSLQEFIASHETTEDNTEYLQQYRAREEHIKYQIQLLEERVKEMLAEGCKICGDELTDPVMDSNCNNITCGKCMLNWVNTRHTCPFCRANMTENNLVYINLTGDTTQNENFNNTREMTKFETILDIVENNPDSKIIIFSSYSNTFEHIRKFLNASNISYTEMKGQIKSRESNLRKFKQGLKKVMFLNSGFNGAGLNLYEATDIILYHEMNDDTTNQIIARVNRVGNTKDVFVHHLYGN